MNAAGSGEHGWSGAATLAQASPANNAAPTAPVRLVTGEGMVLEALPTMPASGTSVVAFVAIGFGLLIVAVVAAFQVRRLWFARVGSSLDEAAASELARRLGLSHRQRETLERVAAADPSVSSLDLLVSVKKFTIAASRHAAQGISPIERQALVDLCRAVGADSPSGMSEAATGAGSLDGKSKHLAASSPSKAGVASGKPGKPRKSVVSPRLIDRRG